MKQKVKKRASQSVSSSNETGMFKAIVSSSQRDAQGKTIPKAVLKRIAEASLNPIPLLAEHDSGEIIGTVIDIFYEQRVLKARGRVFDEDVRNLILNGEVALSIGGWGIEDQTGELLSFDLLEISVVKSPANSDAEFLLIKSFNGGSKKMSGDTKKKKGEGEDPTKSQQNGEMITKAEFEEFKEQAEKDSKELAAKWQEQLDGLNDELNNKGTEVVKHSEKSQFPLKWNIENGDTTANIKLFTDSGERLFIAKSLTNIDVPGATVDGAKLWHKPINPPVFRPRAMIDRMLTGSNFKTTELSNIGYEKVNTVEAITNFDGTLDPTEHQTDFWQSPVRFSESVLSDLPALEPMLVRYLIGELDSKINAEFIALLKASITGAGGATEIKTGTASKSSTTANVVEHLSNLLKAVPARYRTGGIWLLSTDLFQTLINAVSSGGEFALRPMTDSLSLWGYPVEVSDQMDTATANGNLKAMFVSPMNSCLLGIRQDLRITRHNDTMPGAAIFRAHSRLKTVLLDPTGVSGLVVGA